MAQALMVTVLLCILCALSFRGHTMSVPLLKSPYCPGHTVCPPYFVVLGDGTDFEMRCYRPSVWVSVRERGVYDDVSSDGRGLPLWRLQRYFNGRNRQSRRLPRNGFITQTFNEYKDTRSMSFYMPAELSGSFPKPNDTNVHLSYRPMFCAYVYTFHGWVSHSKTIKSKEQVFRQLLMKNATLPEWYPEFYMYASYGHYMMPLHNEIWFIMKLTQETSFGKH